MNLPEQIKQLEELKTQKESQRDTIDTEIKDVSVKLKKLRAEHARQEKRLKDILEG